MPDYGLTPYDGEESYTGRGDTVHETKGESMPDEEFTAACSYVMPFGKHKGKTLARIGANNEGLKYLDWLVGQVWVNNQLTEKLNTYLRHPAIARQLDAVLED